MSNLKLLGLALMLVVGLAGFARADSVYLIVAEDGTFASTPSNEENYTIVNYATVLGGTYPWPLDMAVAAAVEEFVFTPTTEFFFVGTMFDDPTEEDHLLLGAPGEAGTMVLPFVNNIITDINTATKGEGEGTRYSPFPSGLGSFNSTDSDTFWDWFDAGEIFSSSDFVDVLDRGAPGSEVPFNVISNLADGEGVENIFGFCYSLVQTVDGEPNGQLTWLYDSQTGRINKDGSEGLWKPIPEPGSLALMLGALLVAGAVWRRKRSAS
jgi:hypothetical protein